MQTLMPYLAFPLNMIAAFLWVSVSYLLWTSKRESRVVRFLLSPVASVSSIILFLASCLWMGLSGNREFAGTFLFAVVMFYLQTVLLFVIFRGWRKRGISGLRGVRWRFLLNHCGLLTVLCSAFYGAPDSETLRVVLHEKETVAEAYRDDGGRVWLPYRIGLEDCRVERYEDGSPSVFEADVLIGEDAYTLRVNHPCSPRIGEDVYLANIAENGGESVCVLQIVREPWKYPALAGIIMMLTGALLLFLKGPGHKRECL